MAEPRHLPLSERLRPVRLDDVLGNTPARTQLRAWAERWNADAPPAQRAAVLSGPPGVGKTSSALAVAAEFGWSVVEMNASDARNERAIEQVAGRASITQTLMEVPGSHGRHRALILLDEADSLSGRATETAKTPVAPTSLREYLRGRYGSVEDLNRAWGLEAGGKPAPFDDWEKVPRSPGNFAWARLATARRDLDDWRGSAKPRDSTDRGGLAAIARLVRATRQPLILTVNDEQVLTRYSAVFRTAVARIRFGPVRERELTTSLNAIARREGFDLAGGAIDAIVRRSHGDVRAALNDLDAIAPIPKGPLQLGLVGSRDIASDFAAVTEEVLSDARFYRSVEIRDRLDAPPDDLFPWIEENLPYFAPDAAHRAAAVGHLAEAERLLARARRFRVWGLWSYATEVMTGGVSLSIRDAPVPVAGRAQFPRFLGEMGRSRSTRAIRDAIAQKAGRRFHLSRAKARDSVLPFLERLFDAYGDRSRREALAGVIARLVRELELTAEEIGYIAQVPAEAALIEELLDRRESERNSEAAAPSEPSSSEPEPNPEPERRAVQRQLSDFGGRGG
jgi:DNA polymerase III delta prime subunit